MAVWQAKAIKRAKKASKPAGKKSQREAKKPAQKTQKNTKKAAAKNRPRKAAPKEKIIGEGDYAASRSFLKDQAGFVEENRAKIPALGKDAERALDGPEGADLRDAEATAAARSRDTF